MKPKQLKETLRGCMKAKLPVLLKGAPGIGKCLGKGTPILMYDGTIKDVENIIKGDRIMGPDSKPRQVQSTTKGKGELYWVIPKKGLVYIVNKYHVLSLRMSPVRIGRKSRTIEISVGEYLKTSTTFKHHAKEWRTGVDFAEQGILLDPYLLGLWLGDGDRRRPCFTNIDPEIIDWLIIHGRKLHLPAKFYKTSNTAKHIALTGKRGGGRSSRGQNTIQNSLEYYGLVKAKHVPHVYKANSREVRLQVLAGLIDTDGSLASNCYEIVQKSRRLSDDIVFLARSLGLAAYLKKTKKTCTNTGAV
ncbi:hypothetical protein LCGC14_1968460, partial [marine sediment metagenome]